MIYRMVAVLLGLAACTEVKRVDVSTNGYRVAETSWGLRKLLGVSVDHGNTETATLGFRANGHIGGTASCNLVGGKGLNWTGYVGESGGDIAHDFTEPMIQTVVGCLDTRKAAAAEGFWRRMETAKAWSLGSGKLTITFDDGGVAELAPIAPPVTPSTAANSNRPSHNFDVP